MKKPEDISKLDEKIGAFRKKKRALNADKTQKYEPRSAAKGFQMSVELISAVLVGAAMGYFFDYVFKTSPWFLCVLTIFGGAAGILNVYRTAKAEDEERDNV